MPRSTCEEKKTKEQIVWLLIQMGVVVNDIINIKQQINVMAEKRSCQRAAVLSLPAPPVRLAQ